MYSACVLVFIISTKSDLMAFHISFAIRGKPTDDAVNTAGTEVNTASASVTTAGVSVSTAKPITTASTLVKMKSEKSKVRGVVMQEPSKTATRPTLPPQQHDPKDKGKGNMVEQEKPLKEKDQIKFDEEIAQRLQAQMQAELEEEERLARERKEDANIAEWDNAQAMMDADYELAARIQAQEQEELTIEEKLRLFVELMDKRKKHFSRLRAEEQRRKPLTKAQKRNQMCTYLKNMAGFTHNQLKNKSFDEVQKAFDKTMSWIDSFVPVDSEVVKGSKDRAEGSETRAEGSSKRAGEDLQQESTKKQKIDDDKEKEELKQCFEIVLDDGDDVTIDATPLSVKIPIVDYKIYQEGKKSFFQIIRADGKTQMYLTFSKMLKNFDREELEVLWRIVKARFKKTEPVNYMDTFLHINLKTMFEHHAEDMQTIPYYLLVEKMYPLTKHTLHQMFNNVKIQVDYESEMAYDLLRLYKVNDAEKVNAAGYKLVLLDQLSALHYPPDFIEVGDLESDAEFVDTPLVSHFLDSNYESNDSEVINDIYGNTAYCDHDRRINKFDIRDLAFPCIQGSRQFVAYFEPNLSMKIIKQKAFTTIMGKELASRNDNFVAIVRNVHVFVGSFT
ncbi:hypothetical protein Tco_1539937 [Tanacetum coccineum]